MLEMTLQEALDEVQILRGLMRATEDFSKPTIKSIGGLCGLIREACGWPRDEKVLRILYLQAITAIPQLVSTKQLTQGVVSVMVDAWLREDYETEGWHANEKAKQLFVHIAASPEAFALS